jgi:DNA-binding NtrC family response regulator
MTGNQDDATVRTMRSRGAVDYLAKPFSLERLEGVVAAALSVRRAVSR